MDADEGAEDDYSNNPDDDSMDSACYDSMNIEKMSPLNVKTEIEDDYFDPDEMHLGYLNKQIKAEPLSPVDTQCSGSFIFNDCLEMKTEFCDVTAIVSPIIPCNSFGFDENLKIKTEFTDGESSIPVSDSFDFDGNLKIKSEYPGETSMSSPSPGCSSFNLDSKLKIKRELTEESSYEDLWSTCYKKSSDEVFSISSIDVDQEVEHKIVTMVVENDTFIRGDSTENTDQKFLVTETGLKSANQLDRKFTETENGIKEPSQLEMYLNRPVKRQCTEELKQEMVDRNVAPLQGSSHQCPKCSARFHNNRSFKKHLQIHGKSDGAWNPNGTNISLLEKLDHPVSGQDEIGEENNMNVFTSEKTESIQTCLQCSKCSARFHNSKSLDRHMLMHEKQALVDNTKTIGNGYTCRFCSLEFSCQKEYLEHVNELRLTCPICKVCINCVTYYSEHVSKVHVKTKNANIHHNRSQCRQCLLKFGNVTMMYKHVNLQNCHFCKRKFFCTTKLSMHLLQHVNERDKKVLEGVKDYKVADSDYVCRYCDAKFTDFTQFCSHSAIHNSNISLPRYANPRKIPLPDGMGVKRKNGMRFIDQTQPVEVQGNNECPTSSSNETDSKNSSSVDYPSGANMNMIYPYNGANMFPYFNGLNTMYNVQLYSPFAMGFPYNGSRIDSDSSDALDLTVKKVDEYFNHKNDDKKGEDLSDKETTIDAFIQKQIDANMFAPLNGNNDDAERTNETIIVNPDCKDLVQSENDNHFKTDVGFIKTENFSVSTIKKEEFDNLDDSRVYNGDGKSEEINKEIKMEFNDIASGDIVEDFSENLTVTKIAPKKISMLKSILKSQIDFVDEPLYLQDETQSESEVKISEVESNNSYLSDMFPYQCRYCDLRFRSTALFINHARRHDGESNPVNGYS